MLDDVTLFGTAAIYVIAAGLLIATRFRDEDEERLVRIAAVLAGLAGLSTLATNLIFVLSPDLADGSAEFYWLVAMSALFPAVTILGAVLTFLRVKRGLRVLVAGLGLWGIITLIGIISVATNAFA